jgi:hypothetical protein
MFILFFIAGIILIIATFFLITRIQFIRKGIITEATVDNRFTVRSTSDDDSNKVHATFKFYTPNNEEAFFKEEFSETDKWQVGDKATIAYQTRDPQYFDPYQIVFLDYWGSFGVVTILFSLAFVLILIAAGYYRAEIFFERLG